MDVMYDVTIYKLYGSIDNIIVHKLLTNINLINP
jgi:hypothetical protein